LIDLKGMLHIRKPVIQNLHRALVRQVHALPRVLPRFVQLGELASFSLTFSVQLPIPSLVFKGPKLNI
jgi:hypothetical protein